MGHLQCGVLLDLTAGDRDVSALLVRQKRGAAARGALVRPEGRPLAALAENEKLHIVAGGDGARVANRTPSELVALLHELGMPRDVRIRQIHLIADDTGSGGAESYAARVLTAVREAGFNVAEIKAPLGRVRWDAAGKIHVLTPAGWQLSRRELNVHLT
jgi:hypothetical protein